MSKQLDTYDLKFIYIYTNCYAFVIKTNFIIYIIYYFYTRVYYIYIYI